LPQPDDITGLLQAWADGDEAARDAAIELAYAELRRIAQNRLRTEGDALTLDATGLAHEAFLKLAGQKETRWQSRAQFFAIVARVMRRILVDRQRARRAQKRGGGTRVAFSGLELEVGYGGAPNAAALGTPRGAMAGALTMPGAWGATGSVDLDRLNDALDRLALQDPRQAQIVELRFFAGLTIEEAGEAAGISPATLKREWALARAWLKRELDRGD
jgi:DNA-directed RNA polymerase specialized sigma24 family protein